MEICTMPNNTNKQTGSLSRRKAIKMLALAAGNGVLLDKTSAWAKLADAGGTAIRLLSPAFKWLRMGEVLPAGWIKDQLRMDLRQGFAGCLDQLAPQVVATDIFASGRVGIKGGPHSDTIQPNNVGWWNGESEGNWRTGYIMMSYLSGDQKHQRLADAYVRHILDWQDQDGYIGVYAPANRFSQNPRNGELWTQTCILRGLMAYYELTDRREVLDAVQRAVACTIAHYGPGKQPAFMCHPNGGGIAHGLMFTDVLERLYDLTGRKEYTDFGLWLYQDYCSHVAQTFRDDTLACLLQRNRPLYDHAVHVYEQIRTVLWCHALTGRSDLARACRNAFFKVQRYTFPSGAAVGMETVGARKPDPTHCYYEYCDLKELLFTFTSGIQKLGSASLGDRAEQVMFNAAQGARSPGGKAITYLTRDNRYKICGALGNRDKFSPTHEDVAVCCVPNATQIMSLYVRSMWMRTADTDGLVAAMHGPCTIDTHVRGVKIHIDEQTHYPFSPELSIMVSPERSVEFPILIRNPAWSKNTRITCANADIRRRGDYFAVHKAWRKGDRITVTFQESIEAVPAVNGEMAIQKGPLVYAMGIPSDPKVVKTYPVPGYEDTYDFPPPGVERSYRLSSGNDFGLSAQVDHRSPKSFESIPLRLEGKLVDAKTGKRKRASLVPMGCGKATLRQITFSRS